MFLQIQNKEKEVFFMKNIMNKSNIKGSNDRRDVNSEWFTGKTWMKVLSEKNKEKNEDGEFKKITEAYNFLKKNEKDNTIYQEAKQNSGNQRIRPKPQWGAPEDDEILE